MSTSLYAREEPGYLQLLVPVLVQKETDHLIHMTANNDLNSYNTMLYVKRS